MRFVVLLLLALSRVMAQEAFKPPQGYDATRYAADWSRNPFTLQTTPAGPVENAFAKDLAVASCYGDMANPTVVVVNTKTHQRFTLQKGRPSEQGWLLGAVQIGASRQGITAELWRGNERAVLKYDANYVRALASSSAQPAATPKRTSGPSSVPAVIPLPRVPKDDKQGAAVPGAVTAPATPHVSQAAALPATTQQMLTIPSRPQPVRNQ